MKEKESNRKEKEREEGGSIGRKRGQREKARLGEKCKRGVV